MKSAVKRLGLALSTAGVLIAGLTTATLPASAGTNGQHVTICAKVNGQNPFSSVRIWGTNNLGDYQEVTGGFTFTDGVGFNQYWCAPFTNVWMKGNLGVRLYYPNGSYTERYGASVPVSQPSDYYRYNTNS
jgi:hypothetical protein